MSIIIIEDLSKKTVILSGTSQNSIRGMNKFYRPELDILRFLAFLAVFVQHSFSQDPNWYVGKGLSEGLSRWAVSSVSAGGFGVDIFFTLSSYLITEILVREHLKSGRIRVLAFYMRRLLRICPLYYLFLALAIFVVPLILHDDYLGRSHTIAFLSFTGNWTCASLGYPQSVAAPLWSVSIEEQFYLTWPVLISLLGVRRILGLASLLLAVASASRLILWVVGTEHPGVWCNTFARLDPIACGAIVAIYLRGRKPRLTYYYRLALLSISVAILVASSKYLTRAGTLSLILYPATAIASTLLLVASFQRGRATWNKYRAARLACYLGRISYGLYVFHVFGLRLSGVLTPGSYVALGIMFQILLGLLITVALASISYRWFEQPFLRLKRQFSPTGGLPAYS